MDTKKPIDFRGFSLNTATQTGGGGIASGIAGCQVVSVDFSDVDVVQFQEKRSQEDGLDTGIVLLGGRRVRMAGSLFDVTRPLMFDRYFAWRAALSPTLAQMDSPADHGYQPLTFSVPTNNVADWPSGYIDMQVFAMPKAIDSVIQQSNQGGPDEEPLAIPWQATFVMKDPRIYAQDIVDTDVTLVPHKTGTAAASTDLVTLTSHGLVAGNVITFTTLTGGTGLALGTLYYVIASGLTTNAFKVSTTSGGSAVDITGDYSVATWLLRTTQAGNLKNRGTYTCPVDALWVVGGEAGTIYGSIGDSQFTIAIPASTGSRTIRYKGIDKVLTIEENSIETLAMSSITWQNDTTWALVPPGTSAYSFTYGNVNVQSGSHFWIMEAWA